MAMAMEICRPGTAPNISPSRMPGMTMSHGLKSLNSSESPALRASISSMVLSSQYSVGRISMGMG